MSRAITVRNLKKNFARVVREPGLRGSLRSLVRRRVEAVPAVRGVSFKVEKGEILGFLGPNGAGKSTTMRMITGFLPPNEGSAVICGHDILKNPVEAKKCAGPDSRAKCFLPLRFWE